MAADQGSKAHSLPQFMSLHCTLWTNCHFLSIHWKCKSLQCDDNAANKHVNKQSEKDLNAGIFELASS